MRVRVYTSNTRCRKALTLREERVAVERRPVDRPASACPAKRSKIARST